MKEKRRNPTSKYLRKYGLRLDEMAVILNMGIASVHRHLQDEEKRPELLRRLFGQIKQEGKQ